MKKSVAKNYIYNLGYQIIILILPLITTPYISRALGAESIGIYSYTLSISAYFIMFGSLGVTLYGQREIAYHQTNKKKYSITFWEIVIFRLITMIISLTVFYFVFARNSQYALYYKILMLEILASCFDISWFFQGLEDFKKTVGRNLLVKFISIILIFTLVKTPQDLNKYFFIYVFSVLVGNISLWLYLPKHLKRVKLKELYIFRHLVPTLVLFIPQIAIQVYTLLDRTMIGTIILDKSEVGFYDQSQKIIKMLLAVVTSLGPVMLPRIASTFAKGDKEQVTNYMKKSFNMVFLLAFPMIFGCISISKAFVPVFFGEGYDKVVILMSIISPIILLIGLSNVTGTQFLLPTKRQKEYTISVICGAVINFILNSFLIWNFGAIGASIGTVVAELVVTIVQMYFVRNDFKIINIIKLSTKYLISALIMFAVCFAVRTFVYDNLTSIMIQLVVGGLVYGTCLLVMKDEFIFEVINKMMYKVGLKK